MRYGVYIRLSKTDDDRAASLEQQAEACRRYVAAQGGTVVLEAQDIQSGLDPQRPGYQSILQAARDKRIDGAIVMRFDRWGRDVLEALRSFRELADLGIEVRSVSESNEDPFLRDLMLLLANRESRVIAARTKPVMMMQAKEGRWQAKPPTGYDLVGGKLVPNDKAHLMRALFERAANGESLASLRRWAHSVGLTSPSGRLPIRSTVHTWLRNPVYAGDLVFNRRAWNRFERHHKRPESEWVVVEDAHPAIIDRETFDAVQASLRENRLHQGKVRRSQYMLTGRIYCARCGGRMHGHRRSDKKNTYRYQCYAGTESGTCSMKSTGGATVDRWVKQQIGNVQISRDIRRRAAEVVRSEVEQEIAERSRQRQSLEAAYERHQGTREKLAARRVADEIPPSVYRRLEEKEATAIRAIEQEMGKLEAPPPVPDLTPVLDVLESITWDSLDSEAWGDVVALLVERVGVRDLGDYRLTWTTAGKSLARALASV